MRRRALFRLKSALGIRRHWFFTWPTGESPAATRHDGPRVSHQWALFSETESPLRTFTRICLIRQLLGGGGAGSCKDCLWFRRQPHPAVSCHLQQAPPYSVEEYTGCLKMSSPRQQNDSNGFFFNLNIVTLCVLQRPKCFHLK